MAGPIERWRTKRLGKRAIEALLEGDPVVTGRALLQWERWKAAGRPEAELPVLEDLKRILGIPDGELEAAFAQDVEEGRVVLEGLA